MEDIIILGAGNFAREVAQLIEDINDCDKNCTAVGIPANPCIRR